MVQKSLVRTGLFSACRGRSRYMFPHRSREKRIIVSRERLIPGYIVEMSIDALRNFEYRLNTTRRQEFTGGILRGMRQNPPRTPGGLFSATEHDAHPSTCSNPNCIHQPGPHPPPLIYIWVAHTDFKPQSSLLDSAKQPRSQAQDSQARHPRTCNPTTSNPPTCNPPTNNPPSYIRSTPCYRPICCQHSAILRLAILHHGIAQSAILQPAILKPCQYILRLPHSISIDHTGVASTT
jgi:hypothetical protein